MDNLAHSLAGAALGEAGLKKKTGLGMATLILAANLPDIDVLGLLFGENLAWRRGWTHGPIAMLVLPPLLVGALILFDRWQRKRGTRPADRAPLHVGWLITLAYIGWISHPALDLLNTYGIRLLMPFSEQWFYGDTLFIIDLWLWLALGLGVWVSRRRARLNGENAQRPAQLSLLLSLAYISVMGASSLMAETMTRDAALAKGHGPITAVVANPVPLNPFRRDMVYASQGTYRFGEVVWLPSPRVTLQSGTIVAQMDHPAIVEARKEKTVADFLYWSRLPYATIEESDTSTRVTLSDARYTKGTFAGPFVLAIDLKRAPIAEQAKGAPQRP